MTVSPWTQASHCWQKNCGPDPFHTVTCVSTGASIALFGVGYFDSSLIVEILAAIAAAGGAISSGRLAYLKPFSDEGHTARQIRKAAKNLQVAENQTSNEINLLNNRIAEFQLNLEKAIEEKAKLETNREENLTKIQELTRALETIETTGQETTTKLQFSVEEEKELSAIMEKNTQIRSKQIASLASINTHLDTSADNVHKDVEQLTQNNERIEKENTKLQNDISELRQVIEQFEKAVADKNQQLEEQKKQMQDLARLEEINTKLTNDIERLVNIAGRTFSSNHEPIEAPSQHTMQ